MALIWIVMTLVVLGSTLWVARDAPGRAWTPNVLAKHHLHWVAGTLALWVIYFPAYLLLRGSAPRDGEGPPPGPQLMPPGTMPAPAGVAGPASSVAPPGFVERPALAVSAAPPAPAYAPAPRRTLTRRERRSAYAVLFVAALVALTAILHGVPRGWPLGPPSAAHVEQQLEDAGLPFRAGTSQIPQIAYAVRHGHCDESQGIVSTTGDPRAWAVVCVGPPRGLDDLMLQAASTAPSREGPVYADARSGDVLVVGSGWPAGTARQVADALGGAGNRSVGP